MLEKLIKSFHLLDEEKECLIWDSINEKDSDIFPDEFQNTNFSFIQFLIIIENWLNNNVDEKFKQKQMII